MVTNHCNQVCACETLHNLLLQQKPDFFYVHSLTEDKYPEKSILHHLLTILLLPIFSWKLILARYIKLKDGAVYICQLVGVFCMWASTSTCIISQAPATHSDGCQMAKAET